MKLKMFAAIVESSASYFDLCERYEDARDIRQFVAELKPFARKDLAGFFTAFSRRTPDSADQSQTSRLKVKRLAKALAATGQLLGAAGAKAKANELAATADELVAQPDVPVHALMERVRVAQEEAKQAEIAAFVARLDETQKFRDQFEKVVLELGKLPPDFVGAVAVGYVQGKSKYGSKPKALAAIRDKQFERQRLANRMND